MQLNALIKTKAQQRTANPVDIRKQYVFALFYKRIFGPEASGWILLGGNALLARTGGGRFTQDIDLARAETWESVDEIRNELESLLLADLGDPFRFTIRDISEHDRRDEYGYGGRTVKVKITALLGNLDFEHFELDITQRRHVTGPVDQIRLTPVIGHGTLNNLPLLPVVPLENHLADKICALYETHQNGPSTRYRDLADIVRIVQDLKIRADRLKDMLDHERGRRRLTLPASLTSPGAQWETAYPQAAREFAEFPAELRALDSSLDVASACLNAVLSGAVSDGVWNPSEQRWQASSDDEDAVRR